MASRRFPRLYVAASLKHAGDLVQVRRAQGFSAALCRGLIEAGWHEVRCHHCRERFPRLYVAASLKQGIAAREIPDVLVFSAALCRGLIEAAPRSSCGRRC